MAKVAIVHPNDPKRPKTIAAERFDPAVHTRWEEREEAEPEVGAASEFSPGGATGFDALPDDFPGKRPLEEAGITTIHGVRSVQDYDEIPGIGQVTEEEIVTYLQDLEAEE